MTTSRRTMSALWAAYGDALGFISERRDTEGLKRTIDSRWVGQAVSWERRVGGRFGPTVLLPKGCYSDDTQLRLATSRAIRGDGSFDVEAFAKVELPVWLSYHLGAGRGTKAAARNLSRRDVAWYSNFFDEKGANYVQSGGNGAAMRIQPHVWAARTRGGSDVRLDVLRNALTTHGHCRGFLGAVFHAECLSHALKSGTVPGPEEWSEITESLGAVPRVIADDENLLRVWLPIWESKGNVTLPDAVRSFQEEHRADVKAATALLRTGEPEFVYKAVLRRIGGLAAPTVGSGSKTALLASVLSYLFREAGANAALVSAANQLGSDTDTIASMAGALMGVAERSVPEVTPVDAEYIISEASRLAHIAEGRPQPSFRYPDLLHWRAPKAALDVVARAGADIVIAGLGPAKRISSPSGAANQDSAEWQWMRLAFGQSVLVKHRSPLPELPKHARTSRDPAGVSERPEASGGLNAQMTQQERATPVGTPSVPKSGQSNLFGEVATGREEQAVRRRSLEEITSEVIASGFDPVNLGRNLLWILDHARNPIEAAVAFAAIVAKARATRQGPERSRGTE